MTDEKIVNAAIQRLEEIVDQGQRFAQLLIAFTENTITKGEFVELCAEIFNESRNVLKSSKSYLRLIVEHLLILKYGMDEDSHNHISIEIVEFRRSLRDDLNWGRKDQQTNLINHLKEALPDIYLDGIDAYREHATESKIKTPNLKKILTALPSECPWTLEEIITNDLDDLLSYLPD